MDPTKLEPGAVLLAKYRVDQILGKGAMGVVYAVTHVDLGQRFALKVLATRATDEARARFLREARASARLKTQHVAKVVDVGTIDDTPYMLMEHLDGRDLAAELKASGPLPFGAAVDLMLQACEAVAEAHAAGIVHRDIKPANLFLTTAADGSPCVKVLDFGVSKVRSEVDMTGDFVLGSPLYMSPEQMRASAEVDGRADVWALAVTLFQLVAGKTPFHASGIEAVMTRVYLDPPDPLATYRGDAPPGFEALLGMALEKDRARRFPSVAAFAAALAPFGSATAATYAERVARVLGEQVAIARPTAELGGPTMDARAITAAPPPAAAVTDGAMLHATAVAAPARGGRGKRVAVVVAALALGGMAAVGTLGGRGRPLPPTSTGPGTSGSAPTAVTETSTASARATVTPESTAAPTASAEVRALSSAAPAASTARPRATRSPPLPRADPPARPAPVESPKGKRSVFEQ